MMKKQKQFLLSTEKSSLAVSSHFKYLNKIGNFSLKQFLLNKIYKKKKNQLLLHFPDLKRGLTFVFCL